MRGFLGILDTIDHTGQTLRPLPNFITNFNHLKCLRYLKTRPKEVYHYALKYTKTVFVGWLVCWETGADAKRERGVWEALPGMCEFLLACRGGSWSPVSRPYPQ